MIKKKKYNICFKKTNLSWDDAYIKTSKGYSSENILFKCRESLLKIKNGEYPYERDSVLFKEKEIFFPLLTSLLFISSEYNNILNIIDFGGSLGSTYFQNRDLLVQAGITVNWNIIEQDNFVKCGKEYFQNRELQFFNNIDDVFIENAEISICLLSSVLPYLKEPYNIIKTILKYNIKYLIIDRTFFLLDELEDILTIQNTSSNIYKASYPAWFFSLKNFNSFLNIYYNIIFKWDSIDKHHLHNFSTLSMGYFLKKINATIN